MRTLAAAQTSIFAAFPPKRGRSSASAMALAQVKDVRVRAVCLLAMAGNAPTENEASRANLERA